MLAVAIVAVLCLFPVAYAKLLEQPQGNAQTADAETVRNDQTQQLLGAVSTLRDGAGKCISFKASQIESDLSAEGTGGGLNTLTPCILPLPACVWLYFCTIAIPQRLPGVCVCALAMMGFLPAAFDKSKFFPQTIRPTAAAAAAAAKMILPSIMDLETALRIQSRIVAIAMRMAHVIHAVLLAPRNARAGW